MKYNNAGLTKKSQLSDKQIIEQSGVSVPQRHSGTEITEGLHQNPISFQEVIDAVSEYLPNSEEALKLILAVTVASQFDNPVMLWLLLVGVPSSGKTDLVRLVKGNKISYYLDNLTQNAFISGERPTEKEQVHDLLPELDKKCLVLKDWTVIFSLDERMTKKLLGDLVGIYDKEFAKFSSRRGIVKFTSTFSQLGCITPATLNHHARYLNMVGARFLCYTVPESTPEANKASLKAIFSNQNRTTVERKARDAVSQYIDQLIDSKPNIDAFSPKAEAFVTTAAQLMAHTRGTVIIQTGSFKNEKEEDVTYYEPVSIQIEEPWRALTQLKLLAEHLAFVTGKSAVGDEELAIIREVTLSSMPADRSQALRELIRNGGTITASQLSDATSVSGKTSRRILAELVALKVVNKDGGSGTIAADYHIVGRFKQFLIPSNDITPFGEETLDLVAEVKKIFEISE